MEKLIRETLGESVSIHYVCNIIIKQKHHWRTKVYNLDAILSVGYRVNSQNTTTITNLL